MRDSFSFGQEVAALKFTEADVGSPGMSDDDDDYLDVVVALNIAAGGSSPSDGKNLPDLKLDQEDVGFGDPEKKGGKKKKKKKKKPSNHEPKESKTPSSLEVFDDIGGLGDVEMAFSSEDFSAGRFGPFFFYTLSRITPR